MAKTSKHNSLLFHGLFHCMAKLSFSRMPFGLINAPAAFQGLMITLLVKASKPAHISMMQLLGCFKTGRQWEVGERVPWGAFFIFLFRNNKIEYHFQKNAIAPIPIKLKTFPLVLSKLYSVHEILFCSFRKQNRSQKNLNTFYSDSGRVE